MRIVNTGLTIFYTEYYSREEKPVFLVYEAPTGYGKSTLAPLLGRIVGDKGLAYSYIHVLPMRSIVLDLYRSLVEKEKPPLDMLGDIGEEDVGYQASGIPLAGKDPFLAKRYTVTTIDSFFLNLVKIGVGERNLWTRHYEASRSMIFTSTTVFDEAHLYGGDPGSPEEILFTSLVLSIDAIAAARSPLIVTSATIPSELGKYLYNRLYSLARSYGAEVLWVKYGKHIKYSEGLYKYVSPVKYIDREYEYSISSIKWSTRLHTSIQSYIEDIVDDALSGRRVLVIANKPRRAVELYRTLIDKGLKPTLIHGRMSFSDRRKVEENIRDVSLLVATQVVEAGIDVSFDVLYTDIAPISNLVQRAGRVNRKLTECRGVVNIVIEKDAYNRVYSEEIVEKTIGVLKKYIGRGINWRSSKSTVDYVGVTDLLDSVYIGYKPDIEWVRVRHYRDAIHRLVYPRKNIVKQVYSECLAGKGIVRGSMLVTIYPVEGGEDYSIDKLVDRGIPVSTNWLIGYRDKLFREGAWLINIGTDGTIELKMLDKRSIADEHLFRKIICMLTLNYTWGDREATDKRYLLGLGFSSNIYKIGEGLIV